MLNSLLSVLNSPLGIAAIAFVGVALFFIVRFVYRAKPQREVQFLRPRDRRGERLVITKETDRSIACERSNPVHRFVKMGAAYTFREGGRMITRFWGIEGTAYTGVLEDLKEVKLSISDFLKSLWGDEFYDKMPDEQKKIVEEDNIGVTITPVPIVEEEWGLPTLTSDDVNDEGDSIVLERIANVMKPSGKRELYQMMIGAGLGFGLAAILLRMGYL